jgi:hypothetical protein
LQAVEKLCWSDATHDLAASEAELPWLAQAFQEESDGVAYAKDSLLTLEWFEDDAFLHGT